LGKACPVLAVGWWLATASGNIATGGPDLATGGGILATSRAKHPGLNRILEG
jgi:hypothetical protein